MVQGKYFILKINIFPLGASIYRYAAGTLPWNIAGKELEIIIKY